MLSTDTHYQMKKSILFLALLACGFCATGHANFSGSDNLDSDTGNWGNNTPLPSSSVGIFTQTSRLEYSTSGSPTAKDMVVHPWIENVGN